MLPSALRKPTRQGILAASDSIYEWRRKGEHVSRVVAALFDRASHRCCDVAIPSSRIKNRMDLLFPGVAPPLMRWMSPFVNVYRMGGAMKSVSLRSPLTSSLRRLFVRNGVGGSRLFQLEQLRTQSRYHNEALIRELCASAYLGEGRSLCRVLGRYKMIVDTSDAGLSSHLLLDGYWEMWLTELLNNLVRPGMKVIDVGANLGYFSLLMADLVGPKGSVHAFEPNADLAHRMTQSVAINGFQKIVTIHKQALSDEEAEVLLVIPQDEPKNGYLLPGDHPVSADKSVESRRLRTKRLDSYDNLADADLIKIDADTSELAIWEGMRGILEAGRPLKVVLEFAHARYADPGAFIDRIRGDCFSIAEITPERGVQPVTQAEILAAPATSDVMLLLER